jgi:multiple sugar transport system permease protein
VSAKRSEPGWSGYLYVAPYALVFACFVVLPFGVSLALSFCQYDLAADRPPRFVGFQNFAEAINDPFFWRALVVTLRYVAWIIPTQLVLSVLLGVGMHALTRGGQQTVRAMLFLPGMFSIAVTGILWQWFYNQEFGLFNTLLKWVGLPGVPWLSSVNLAMPSIVLMTLWWTLGGSAAIVLTGLQQIPRQIHEAAAIDGASAWQSFWKITLPMLKPVLLFTIVMNTIGAFQMFAQSMLLTGGGPEMSTRGVVSLIYDTAFANYRLGYAAAISWLLFLFIASFSFIQFRLIRRLSE